MKRCWEHRGAASLFISPVMVIVAPLVIQQRVVLHAKATVEPG